MFTRHDDVGDDRVRHALAEGWGLRAGSVEYAPVGFGSYHWRAEAGDGRWFVTADELAPTSTSTDARRGKPLRRLSAALTVARSLRDSGMRFVVAPERTTAGGVVHVVDDRFAFAVYPTSRVSTTPGARTRPAAPGWPCSTASPRSTTPPPMCAGLR